MAWRAAVSMIPDKTENEQDCWRGRVTEISTSCDFTELGLPLQHCEHTGLYTKSEGLLGVIPRI